MNGLNTDVENVTKIPFLRNGALGSVLNISPVGSSPLVGAPVISSDLPLPIRNTNYRLVWSDEFSGTSIDSSKWNTIGQWGGAPLTSSNPNFTYSGANVTESSGFMTIAAHGTGGPTWNAGVISTDGLQKWAYGFVEVRAKLPRGKSFLPAIWMYGQRSGDQGLAWEIDIIEICDEDFGNAYQTKWYPNGGKDLAKTYRGDLTTDFHLYQLQWEPNYFAFYIDNILSGSWTTNIPTEQMFLIINFDVGGTPDWNGAPDATTPNPAYLVVDYARVYQVA